MNKKLKRCEACNDPFREDDNIVIVDDELYHGDCVTIYPTGFVAYITNGDCLGETENDEGQNAYEILDAGEYLEGSE